MSEAEIKLKINDGEGCGVIKEVKYTFWSFDQNGVPVHGHRINYA